IIAEGAEQLIIDLRQNPGGDNSFSDPMIAWFADEPFRFYAEFLIRSSDEAAASNAARLEASGGDENSVSARFAREYERVPRGEMFPFELPYAEPRDGQRFEGKVYALINRHSYSNAVNAASVIQDYGFGTVAGEKTSDMATTYGSMEQFQLPNTGISVGFPKSHIIRPSGARKTDGVTPDLALPSPIVQGEEDEVLNALLARLVPVP
ncbi:MAG: S41 family peptidase, partial [Pseudomonadota bacterium]